MNKQTDNLDQGQHQSVLLDEAIDSLAIKPGGCYVDCTFGRGGHSQAILDKLNSLDGSGVLFAMDKDPQAIAHAKQYFSDPRFHIKHGGFADVQAYIAEMGMLGRVDGILMDLGISSPQVDDAERGFSFLRDGPLDMRMNNQAGMSAAEWVAQASAEEMARVFKTYGEERFAKRIANAIVSAREIAPIERTKVLADIIAKAHPAWQKGKHPATQCFQAIRIYLNGELEELEACLKASLEILAPGGRLVVISFHSLEDRIVKRFLRLEAKGGEQMANLPKDLPIPSQNTLIKMKTIGSKVRPCDMERQHNPRARSAVMRVGERTNECHHQSGNRQ